MASERIRITVPAEEAAAFLNNHHGLPVPNGRTMFKPEHLTSDVPLNEWTQPLVDAGKAEPA